MSRTSLPIFIIAALSVFTFSACQTGQAGTSPSQKITVPKIKTNLSIAQTVAPMSTVDLHHNGVNTLQNFRQAYDFTPLYQKGYQGQGQTVAVVLQGANEKEIKQDLIVLDYHYHLPPADVQFVYPDGQKNNPQKYSDSAEPILDVSYVHAFAPAAKIICVVDDNSLGAFTYLYHHKSASIVTYSYSKPEIMTNGTAEAVFNDVLHVMANSGISVFVGTGDWGATDIDNDIKKPSWADALDMKVGKHVNFPASSPWVTAVGGTTLQTNTKHQYTGETAWPYSGGGYSNVFSRQDWQYAAGLPDDAIYRAIPDVSFNADRYSAFPIYYKANMWFFGGTSVSAPAWAAIMALANQVNGKPIGYLNPRLYQIADSPAYSKVFHDVTSGSNGYAARAGWDAVTGLGTPDVYQFVQAVTGGHQ